jgi:hypothetical protein
MLNHTDTRDIGYIIDAMQLTLQGYRDGIFRHNELCLRMLNDAEVITHIVKTKGLDQPY